MNDNHQLVAYLATLLALVVVALGSMQIGAFHPELLNKVEAFSLGTVLGGLVGILRFPTSKSVTVDNPADKPVPAEPAQ